MVLARCILFAMAPAAFWLWLFYRQRRWNPVRELRILKVFGLGALMAVPAYFVQGAMRGPPHVAYDLFVRVALVEEVFKFVPLIWIARRTALIRSPADAITYAVALALGFATVENAIYAFQLGPAILVQRAFTSTPAHAAFSGLLGYHFGLALTRRTKRRQRRVALALITVIALHGGYDLLLHSASGADVPTWVARTTVMLLVPALLGLLWWAKRLAAGADLGLATHHGGAEFAEPNAEKQRSKRPPARAESK